MNDSVVSDRTCRGGLPTVTKQVQQLDHAITRFAGDSGDDMQPGHDRFTQETAIFGMTYRRCRITRPKSRLPPVPGGGARILLASAA
jgi:hypothetical protein